MNKSKMDRLIKAAQICSEALIRVGVVCGVLAQTLAELTDELSEPSAPESAAQPVSEKSEPSLRFNGGPVANVVSSRDLDRRTRDRGRSL